MGYRAETQTPQSITTPSSLPTASSSSPPSPPPLPSSTPPPPLPLTCSSFCHGVQSRNANTSINNTTIYPTNCLLLLLPPSPSPPPPPPAPPPPPPPLTPYLFQFLSRSTKPKVNKLKWWLRYAGSIRPVAAASRRDAQGGLTQAGGGAIGRKKRGGSGQIKRWRRGYFPP